MITINLLPEDLRVTVKSSMFPKISPKKALVLFLGAFFALQVFLTFFSVIKQIELAHVRHELMVFKKQNVDLIKKKSDIDHSRAQLKQFQQMTNRRFYWSRLLNELSDSVTKGIWLRTASFDQSDISPLTTRQSQPALSKGSAAAPDKTQYFKLDGSVVAKGQETAFIGRFIKELKSNTLFIELFDEIELTNINQKKIKDVDVYDFTVICVFKKGVVGGVGT